MTCCASHWPSHRQGQLDCLFALQVKCWHGRCPCRPVSLCQPRCACTPAMPAASSHFMQLCSSRRVHIRLPGQISSQHSLRQPQPSCHRVLGTLLVCLLHWSCRSVLEGLGLSPLRSSDQLEMLGEVLLWRGLPTRPAACA